MLRPRTAVATFLAAVWAAGALPARGADAPVKLPSELAKLLSAARADLDGGKTGQAIQRLEGFAGKDHPLRQLLLGHAYLRRPDLSRSAAAYRRALAMDGRMSQAGIALAQVHARQEDWPKAAELLGRFAEVDSCDAELLLLYAQVARRLDDRRLCRLLVSKAVVRFPRDQRFRRLDLALLADEADYAAAGRAALRLLAEAPADPLLWQQLAFARGQAGAEDEGLSALEAALLCEPASLDRHRQLLAAQLAAGDWLTVLRHGRSLLAGALGKAAAGDVRVMELLIRAADMGGQDEALGAYLKRVGERSWSRPMRLAAARLALRQGKPAQARVALKGLIEAGETDPAVFLWAGHLAETAKDWPEAETLYAHARKSPGPSARLAALYLARLYFRTGRGEQAAQLLRSYLGTWPEDAPARALLALVEAAARGG